MAEALLVERRGPIAILTMNLPETRNALSDALITALVRYLGSANADESLSCIILTGAGDGFCSGGNLKEMQDRTHPMYRGSPYEMGEAYRTNIQQIPLAFERLDVPVIGAINGAAIGAGCDLACMCDIRVASTKARFAESFLRVGIVSGDGGAWLLPRVVGMPRAMEMALTGRVIEPQLAEAWGLATHVVPPEHLMDKAIEIAESMLAFPPISIRLNKRLMKRSAEMSLRDALDLAASYQAIAQNTTDQREALAALLEKRKPDYKGR
ncbi:enoyl-CoA hydratase-related protein [Alsobacter sp. SYSU M60028]|uniref:Enoyl-CoA hydratase-related protein n=1 Tax=Alsobacter ponti TaxID=2962936 RepID=A0ABT1LEM8_9HYPH|nr:enoyl-CoA hydratase-related protein [Alsobacter ponti]MCP8939955.1 enoyl-CoA hydratase-related protein [Alsobacter ponti]